MANRPNQEPQLSPPSKNRWVLPSAIGVLVLLFVFVAGSIARDVVKNEPGCVETELTPQDVVVQDPLQPLKLTAVLLADGKPLVGGEVDFYTLSTQTHSSGRTFDSGRYIGEAITNSDGVAEFIRQEGLDGLTFPSETLTGYQVSFTPLTPINDVQYCFDRNKNAALQLEPLPPQ